jgi:hypothetical protein
VERLFPSKTKTKITKSVFRSPEVCRVYVGSFNADKPPRTDVNPTGAPLFKAEAEDLMSDLVSWCYFFPSFSSSLSSSSPLLSLSLSHAFFLPSFETPRPYQQYAIPARAADRKVNEFVKRVRAAKIHVLILGHLRKALPVVGRTKAQAALLADLPNIFAKVAREHHLPAGDFPDPARYASILRSFELSSFPKLKEKDVKSLEQALAVDVPALVQQFDNPYGAEEDEWKKGWIGSAGEREREGRDREKREERGRKTEWKEMLDSWKFCFFKKSVVLSFQFSLLSLVLYFYFLVLGRRPATKPALVRGCCWLLSAWSFASRSVAAAAALPPCSFFSPFVAASSSSASSSSKPSSAMSCLAIRLLIVFVVVIVNSEKRERGREKRTRVDVHRKRKRKKHQSHRSILHSR